MRTPDGDGGRDADQREIGRDEDPDGQSGIRVGRVHGAPTPLPLALANPSLGPERRGMQAGASLCAAPRWGSRGKGGISNRRLSPVKVAIMVWERDEPFRIPAHRARKPRRLATLRGAYA